MKIKLNKKLIAGIGITLVVLIALILFFIWWAGFYLAPKYGTPPEHGSSYKNV